MNGFFLNVTGTLLIAAMFWGVIIMLQNINRLIKDIERKQKAGKRVVF